MMADAQLAKTQLTQALLGLLHLFQHLASHGAAILDA